jgi:hypothetical protein
MIALMSILLWGCASGAGGDAPNLADLWREWMLAGYFGVWDNGKEVVRPGRNVDKIHSYPDGAYLTKYGIDISTMNSWGNGETHTGGLLARLPLRGAQVELFGKLFAPLRRGGFLVEEESCEIFLVVRSGTGGHGRLVKQWRFGPEELRLTGDPIDPSAFRRSTRNAAWLESILRPWPGAVRFHFVDAFLDVDEANSAATVTVTGLKRPFAERVDLAPYLDGSQGPPPSAPR